MNQEHSWREDWRRTVLLIGAATGLGCQSSEPDLACSSCDIQIEHVVTLASEFEAPPASLIVGPDSTWYVVDSGRSNVLLFDSEGNATGSLGNNERAVATFDRPAVVANLSGDSVIVLDSSRETGSIFSRSRRLERRLPGIDPSFGLIELADGSLVSSNRRPGANLTRYDRAGSIKNMLDGEHKREEVEVPRYLTADTDGSFWLIAHGSSRKVLNLTPSGARRIEILLREIGISEAFAVRGLWLDDQGLIWVLLTVETPDQSILQVYDRQGRLITFRHLSDVSFASSTVGGVLVLHAETATGMWRTSLWRTRRLVPDSDPKRPS